MVALPPLWVPLLQGVGPVGLVKPSLVFDCVFDCAVTDRREVFTAPQHYYSCFEASDHGEVTPDGSV